MLTYDHRAAYLAAHRHRHEYHGYGVACADRREGVLSGEFTGDHAVGDVVHLLEHYANEQRYREHDEGFSGASDRQVLVHCDLVASFL